MLENSRRGSCQQVRVKLEIEGDRYAERSEERGRRRGGEIGADSKLGTSLPRPTSEPAKERVAPVRSSVMWPHPMRRGAN